MIPAAQASSILGAICMGGLFAVLFLLCALDFFTGNEELWPWWRYTIAGLSLAGGCTFLAICLWGVWQLGAAIWLHTIH